MHQNRCFVSDHIPTSDITLEALGRRVASRQRAKEHLRDTERQLRSSGMANKTVQDRVSWQVCRLKHLAR